MIKCGIDIGGTNIKFGFFENDIKLKFFRIKTPKCKSDILLSIKKAIIKNYNLNEIIGYSVAIPGVIKNGVVIYAPNTDIVGIELEKELKSMLENDNIIIDNDANIQALAEARYTNTENLLLLTLGTGFGGGIIINGKLWNHNGFAGEVGHIKVHFGSKSRKCGCGKYGCVESYVSCRAIVKEYNDTTGKSVNSKQLFDLAREKDELARKCIRDCARYLAIAIADLVCTLGIKDVRIAGGLGNAGDVFLRQVRYYYPMYCLPNMEDIKIEKAKLAYEAGVHAVKYLV